MNDQPERRFALTINADELLKPDAVEPVERECGEAKKEPIVSMTQHNFDRLCFKAASAEGKVKKLEAQLADANNKRDQLYNALEPVYRHQKPCDITVEISEGEWTAIQAALGEVEQPAPDSPWQTFPQLLQSVTEGRLRADHAEKERDEANARAEAAEAALTIARERCHFWGMQASEREEWLRKAESRAADLANVLTKVEAYMASEGGPLYRLWENCDIGDYDYGQTEWEQTLFDVRDWKNGCVPAASVGGGTEWPEVLLYREVLKALDPGTREEGEAK